MIFCILLLFKLRIVSCLFWLLDGWFIVIILGFIFKYGVCGVLGFFGDLKYWDECLMLKLGDNGGESGGIEENDEKWFLNCVGRNGFFLGFLIINFFFMIGFYFIF